MILVFKEVKTNKEIRYINVRAWHPVANKDAVVYCTSKYEWFYIDTTNLVLTEVIEK